MPLSVSDLVLVKSTAMAADFTTTPVGGAKQSAQIITGGIIGEALFSMTSQNSGDLTQYAKIFGLNNNATETAYLCKFFLRNALDTVANTGVIYLIPEASADSGGTKKVRLLGYNELGVAIQEEVILSGVSAASVGLFSELHRVELRNVTGGALVAAVGNIEVTDGLATSLGFIPIGAKTATAEVDIGLGSALNDSVTIATAAAAPSGVTFSRPNTVAEALTVPVSGNALGPDDGIAIWIRWVLKEKAKASADWQLHFAFLGSVAG